MTNITTPRYSRIVGTGHYLPERVLTNHDMEKLCDTSHEWIIARSGIEQRHWTVAGQSNSDMAEIAGQRAMEAAGVSPSEIDLVIVATSSADYSSPAVAVVVQHRLGIPPCAAFDMGAACTGFVYGLGIVDQFIRAGSAKRVLLIGSERLSPFVDFSDRSTAVLFGDGAGAVVIEASDEPGLLSHHLYADGSRKDILYLNNGLPVFTPAETANRVYMNGQSVFKSAVVAFSNVIDEALTANNLDKRDIDWLVPHQANIRIIQAAAKKLSLPMEQVVVTVNKTANTSASTIPIALDIAVRDGRIQRGQKLLMAAFGAGLTWGSALLTY